MGFNIKNNYGPNIEVNDGGVVNLRQDRYGRWYTEHIEEAEVVEEETDLTVNREQENSSEELNYDAPKINLQRLLKEDWFAEVRIDNKYDSAWTDAFVEALMASEYGEGIARDWAVAGVKGKKSQLKGYVVGLLKDVGVLKGSYDSIAKKINPNDVKRQFSTYMSKGKKQPYNDWVKEYVSESKEQ